MSTTEAIPSREKRQGRDDEEPTDPDLATAADIAMIFDIISDEAGPADADADAWDNEEQERKHTPGTEK